MVLLDLEMPVLDGLEAARAIRNLTPVDDPRPLLLGLTGHDRDRALPLCREAGMDGCLTKPFPPGTSSARSPRGSGKAAELSSPSFPFPVFFPPLSTSAAFDIFLEQVYSPLYGGIGS